MEHKAHERHNNYRKGRVAEHAVANIFIDRWSPRAFTGESISDETLYRSSKLPAGRRRHTIRSRGAFFMLSAARLGSAHSCGCSANGTNFGPRAAVLLVLISKTSFMPAGKTEALPPAITPLTPARRGQTSRTRRPIRLACTRHRWLDVELARVDWVFLRTITSMQPSRWQARRQISLA